MALVKGLASLSTWVGRLATCHGASTCSSIALNQCPHARATARLGWIAGVATPHPPPSAIMSACHLNRMATSQASPPAQNQSRLKAALSLHASALWATYKTQIWTVGAVASVWVVWRITYLIATSFINVTTTMAEWGFVGIAVGIVAAGAQYARWYWSINPSAVYRRAMMRLNTSPAVLEVLGAPVVGSDLRAHIVTGGNLYMSRKSTFRPKISSRRLQMIFPLRGSERDGLASVEVKRKQGQYLFKLLAVDVRPLSPNTKPARVFLEGTPAVYERGSALGELRDPFLKAVHIQKNIDKEEEMEEEQEDLEEIRRRQDKSRQQRAWWQGVFSSAAAKAAPAAAAVVDQAKAAAGAAAEGAKAAAGVAVDQAKAAAEAATTSTKADTTGTPAAEATGKIGVGTTAMPTAPPPIHSSGSYPSSTPAATPASPSAATAAAMPGASTTTGSAGSGSLRSLLFGPPKK